MEWTERYLMKVNLPLFFVSFYILITIIRIVYQADGGVAPLPPQNIAPIQYTRKHPTENQIISFSLKCFVIEVGHFIISNMMLHKKKNE